MTDATRQGAALPMPPRCTWGLMGLLVFAYFVQTVNTRAGAGLTADALFDMGGNLGYHTLTSEPWRLVTSMLLHADWVHLAMNLGFLAFVGSRVESALGWRRLLVLFFVGGAIAGIGSALWGLIRHHNVVSVGASGGLMALCGALTGAGLMDQYRSVPWLHEERFIKLMLSVVGFTLVYGFIRPRVDQTAHLTGLAAGVALGAWLFSARQSERRVIRVGSVILTLVLVPALVVMLAPKRPSDRFGVLGVPIFKTVETWAAIDFERPA